MPADGQESSRSTPPWKRKNPRQAAGQAVKHLTAAQKTTAKGGAERAGRRYPNLVDNMRVAAPGRRKKKRGPA